MTFSFPALNFDKPANWSTLFLHGLGCLWCLPFIYHRGMYPISTFAAEWLAMLIGLILLLALLLTRRQQLSLPYIMMLPLGLAGLIALQMRFNPDLIAAEAQLGLLYLLWAALMVMLAATIRAEFGLSQSADYLAAYLLFGGLFNLLVELFNTDSSTMFGLGGIGQSNLHSDYLFLALYALIYLYARRTIKFSTLLISLIALSFESALSTSRSAFLYIIAAGLLLAFFRKIPLASFKRLKTGYLLLAGFYIVWQIILPWLGVATSFNRLNTLAADGKTPSLRLFIWEDAWGFWQQNPWLGAGFGRFDWLFFNHARFHDHGFIDSRIEHAHNIVLQLLVEMGSLGCNWFLIMMGLWVWHVLKQPAKLRQFWLLSLFSILAIHSLLEYPLWYSQFLGVFAILLGLGETRNFTLSLSAPIRVTMLTVPLLGLYLLLLTGSNYLRLEKFYEASVRGLDMSAQLDEIVPISNAGLLAPYGQKYFAFTFKMDSDQAEAKAAVVDKAIHFEPIPALAYKQVLYSAYLGKTELAKQQYHLALVAYPPENKWFLWEVSRLNPADQAKLGFLWTN